MKSGWKRVLTACAGTVGTYVLMNAIAKKVTEDRDMDNGPCIIPDCQGDVRKGQQNENEGQTGVYEGKVKPVIDRLLSFFGLVFLSPVFAVISLAIVINDPGPVLFTQKRVGKDKQFFMLHKFRSMKMKTPHDVPTHQLENPEQYITQMGKFLRKYSLDELPQIWDIFRGRMSIIGPRPALWNQYDLVAERDKYGANDILPGLTGWAQINGRDELEIADKARLDGEYAEKLRQGGMKALFFDLKCFLGTVFSVLGSEGVVEGGTGELHKAEKRMDSVNAADIGFEDYGYLKHFDVDISEKNRKRVLITGAGSYIGESFERWAQEHYSANFTIDTLDMRYPNWRSTDFSSYDVVFHVAGIAHADVGKVSAEEKKKYYAVNTDLAVETAAKAKMEGVRQFVFMSSMIIYGNSAPYGREKVIDEHTVPAPANFYGDSKWQADQGVRRLASERFRVAVLRPPMIYGKGSKGNYPVLVKLAKKLPVFPDVENRRSMLYIDNLCEFLCKLMLSGESGVYFPQNEEYTKTSEMVRLIAGTAGKKVWVTKLLKPAVVIGCHVPGKISGLADKAFGNAVYSRKLSVYEGLDYQYYDLKTSIVNAEKNRKGIEKATSYKENKLLDLKGKRILLIALPGYRSGILKKMNELGAEVDIIPDKPNEGILCKTLGRYKVRFYQKIINDYYCKQLEPLKHRNYDYILSIRGEYTPVGALKLMKKFFPSSRLILYMWDGLNKLNTKGIEKKWPYYDRVYTFDRIDYKNHSDELSFLPLYYYEEYLSGNVADISQGDIIYDVSFIGTAHDDRVHIVKSVMKQCEEKGLRCFSYFFMPHRLVYYYNKVRNKRFKNVKSADIRFEMMAFEKLYDIYAHSKCIVDVENAGQHGLTMRSIEVLGLRRKFITTNKDIVNYDFYNPNNILVLDREKPVVDMSFFERPYEELSEEIYKKYSLGNWILEVLK